MALHEHDTQPDLAADTAGGQPADEQASGVQREPPQPPPARAAQVEMWTKRVRQWKSHWGYAFERMRKDMRFARGYQWPDQVPDDERYVANITLRHIKQKTAGLYAKNPTAVAERRKTLDFAVWDGNPQTLQQAQQVMQLAQQEAAAGNVLVLGSPIVAQAQQIMQDVQQGAARRQMLAKIAATLETVYEYEVSEQIPPFKKQMKQLVRRVITTGVGYVTLGYHRLFDYRPEDVDRVTDISEQLALIEQQTADLQDGEIQEHEAQAEELKQALGSLQSQEQVLQREGLDFDYPAATSIIPDMQCKQLQGFVGCRAVAQEFLLSPDQIQRIYGIDIQRSFVRYQESGREDGSEPSRGSIDTDQEVRDEDKAAVWIVYDKSTGLAYTIADGYPDFLEEPAPPRVALERFWPIFTLTFNDVEDARDIFPPSDVSLIRDMQVEHNLSRQRLREHRDAARPKHAAPRQALTAEDKETLTGSSAHTLVELDGLQPGDDIRRLLQPVPTSPIDPNLYEVNSSFEDILKSVGTQEANLGGTSGATATESSIAESSRMAQTSDNVDDLDEFLTELAQASSHVLLSEMSAQTAQEIAGSGAVWPELSGDEIARDLYLTIQAGSSGRPNQAQELQNFERLAPILMQIPGITPQWLAKEAVRRLDDSLDLTDAFIEGMPSITALNGASRPQTGDAGRNPPDAQGPRGSQNSPAPAQTDANQGPNNAASGAPATQPTGAPETASRLN